MTYDQLLDVSKEELLAVDTVNDEPIFLAKDGDTDDCTGEELPF